MHNPYGRAMFTFKIFMSSIEDIEQAAMPHTDYIAPMYYHWNVS
jgi:hypothetical protein